MYKDARGVNVEARNFYGRTQVEREAFRKWREMQDARDVLVVTRASATEM